MKDKIELINDQGQTVQLNLQRQVAALRGSFGLSFPINEHFKLRPYLTLIASDLRSNGNFENLSTAPATDSFNSSAWMYSTVASLDAIYHQWYGEYKLETNVQYHLIYTDSFSEDNPYLATSEWNDALNMKVAISGPSPFKTLTRPWRWQTYAKYTNFLNNNEFALGYSQLIEVGAGLDWQINIKPLDWFGWQSLGLKFGVIFGDDVEGYNFGLTAQ